MIRIFAASAALFCAICLGACKSGSTQVDKDVDDGPYPNWDSGHRGDSQVDTEVDTQVPEDTDTPKDPEVWVELDELWRDCRGTLHITTDAFSWTDAAPSCVLGGSASLEGDQLTLQVLETKGCDGDIPWWVHESDATVYGYEVVGQRLVLIPRPPGLWRAIDVDRP